MVGVQIGRVGSIQPKFNLTFGRFWINIFIISVELELSFLNSTSIWVGLKFRLRQFEFNPNPI